VARIVNTLLARLVFSVVGIQLLLSPLLFSGVLRIIRNSEIDLFVNDARAYSRFLGDMLEFQLPRATEADLVNVLDSVVLSHETGYAELQGPQLNIRSSLLDETSSTYVEDFEFGDHGDDTYFLSIPLNDPDDRGIVLRLGFDEHPVSESLAATRTNLFWILASFMVVSVLLVVILGVLLVRPLRALRSASQTVATGNYDERFGATTQIVEIRDLAADLENMREKLVQANQRLTLEVSERSRLEEARANLERKLRHVQKLETVGTLAGGIAHEFNNVLVPIKMYTELAIDDLPAESSTRADLQRVLAAATRAKQLVQKILAFSRQSEEDHFQKIEVLPIVEDALRLAKDLYPANIQIQEKLDPDCPPIVGDEVPLHQLVVNLLNNAAQAIGTDRGVITVELTRQQLEDSMMPPHVNLAPGDYVVVSIRDTGHGLDAIAREHIFEPFYTTRRPGEGTGLGLSVAHGIAASHGGDIGVESELGRGSTFAVYLPVVTNVNTELSRLGLHKILYIGAPGAAPEHRVAAAAIGGRIRIAGGRAEVLSVLALEQDVDLLILDFSAADFCTRLRPDELPQRRATDARVLVLGPLTEDWETALRSWSHARHLLPKIDAATILSTVKRMLEEHPRKLEESDDVKSAGDRRRTRRL
jgi:signal transduction histidine kinase